MRLLFHTPDFYCCYRLRIPTLPFSPLPCQQWTLPSHPIRFPRNKFLWDCSRMATFLYPLDVLVGWYFTLLFKKQYLQQYNNGSKSFLSQLKRCLALSYFLLGNKNERSVLLTQHGAVDKIEKNEMNWACGAYG